MTQIILHAVFYDALLGYIITYEMTEGEVRLNDIVWIKIDGEIVGMKALNYEPVKIKAKDGSIQKGFVVSKSDSEKFSKFNLKGVSMKVVEGSSTGAVAEFLFDF